jgi:hypothetical protein
MLLYYTRLQRKGKIDNVRLSIYYDLNINVQNLSVIGG